MASRKNYYLLTILLLFFLNINAQFLDYMETCVTDGDPLPSGHWTNMACGGGSGCDIACSSVRSRSGDWSGLIPGDATTDAVLDLGNKIFGDWGLSFWVFIPEGKEASWSILGSVPNDSNEPFAQTYFNQGLTNPGEGRIENTPLGTVSFNFPHNEWFRVIMSWDISTGMGLATWYMWIDGVEVVPINTPFTSEDGTIPNSLGGIEFLSISENNEMYLDDFFHGDSSGGNPFPNLYPFEDNMEYETGDSIGDWWACPPTTDDCLIISSNQALSGTKSGLIPDDASTDVLLDLGSRIQSEWALEFYMYIPSGKEGYFNLQGVLPVGAGELIVGNIYFNKDNLSPGVGTIDDSALGAINFNYPQDEWFRIAMNFDLTGGMTQATWGFSVGLYLLIPNGTPFTNNNEDIATSLGGINFYSISSNSEMYLDDFNYINGILELSTVLIGVNDIKKTRFYFYPNPTKNLLNISSQEPIKSISIYNSLGNIVVEALGETTMDVSNLTSGLYFIEVTTDSSKSVQKFIKK